MKAEQPSDHLQPGAPVGHPHEDALRFWLVTGMHKFAIDPRRGLGSHARARQLLTQDCPAPPASAGEWQSLASTLDRHTVLGGMTELSPQERRVLMLAYLEGCSNREIAIGLGLSAGTVRRLLRRALKRIDTYLTRTGTWIYAILLLGAGHVVDAATRLGRQANAVGSAEWSQKLVSTAAVSTITAAFIGVAGISPDSSSPAQWLPPTTVHAIAVASAASRVTGIRAASAFKGNDRPDEKSSARPSSMAEAQAPVQAQNQGQGQSHGRGHRQGERHTKTKGDNAKHERGGKSTDAPPPAGPDRDSTAGG